MQKVRYTLDFGSTRKNGTKVLGFGKVTVRVGQVNEISGAVLSS